MLTDPVDMAALSAVPTFSQRKEFTKNNGKLSKTGTAAASNSSRGTSNASSSSQPKVKVFDVSQDHNWGDAEHAALVDKVESAFRRAITTPAARAAHVWDAHHHKFIPVALPYYGADIDTASFGSGFPPFKGDPSSLDDAAANKNNITGNSKNGRQQSHTKRRRRRTKGVDIAINSRWNLNALP